MKNKLFLLTVPFLSSALTANQAVATISCQLNQAVPQIVSHLPEMPEWFAKVSPDGKGMYYIGSSSNHLLDIKSNDEETRYPTVPGSLDPVPSPDGRLQTLPGLLFYWVPEILTQHGEAPILAKDSELSGVYQSIGIVSENQETKQTTYRVIVDENEEVEARDYTFDFSGERPVLISKSEIRALCPGRTMKTMIISKDAKYVAAIDADTDSTKIVSTDGTCRDLVDLGFPTGKVEFSYDSKRIAFHVDFFDFDQIGTYFSAIDQARSKDVFTMLIDQQEDGTLKAHSLRRLTATMRKDAGGYYPSFLADGRVAFLYDYDQNYAVHITNYDDTVLSRLSVPPPGTVLSGEQSESINSSFALGSLWMGQCSSGLQENEMTAANVAMLASSIPEADCQSLVTDRWTDAWAKELSESRVIRRDPRFSGAVLLALTKEKLIQFCRDTRPSPQVSEVYGKPGSTEERLLTGPRAMRMQCMGCHEHGSPVPLDVTRLTEYQVLDSLARVSLPAGHEHRMPPGEILTYVNSVGETVNPRQVIIDYLNEKLIELRKMPEPLPVVEAPTLQASQQCYEDEEGWVQYRASMAQKISSGAPVSYNNISTFLTGCKKKIDDLYLQACMMNLDKYASIKKTKTGNFKLGFEVDDDTYYKNLKEKGKIDALAMPTSAEGIDLTNGVPDNWKEVVAGSGEKVRALNYRSRTVNNPGGVGSLNRLLFLVEGEKYDKWIQFTLPEPTKFDEVGYNPLGDSGPERLVDFIAVDKTVSPKKLYFGQYWRNSSGKNPVPRLKDFATHLLGEVPSGVPNQSDTCYSCHAGGMRQLSPQPGSVGKSQFAALTLLNQKMQGYGNMDWDGAIRPEAYGPPMGQTVGCAVCHRNDSNGISDRFTRGPITSAFANGHLRHKVLTDFSMPVSHLVYNPLNSAEPHDVSKILAPIRYLDLADESVRSSFNREFVARQRGGSGSQYPSPDQLIQALNAKSFFANLGVIWPQDLATPSYVPDVMLKDLSAVSQLRSNWLAQQLDVNSEWYKREIGHWIEGSCDMNWDRENYDEGGDSFAEEPDQDEDIHNSDE